MAAVTGGLPAYRLVRGAPPAVAAPVLDPAQQAVVDTVRRPGHGPLLVLAGPGTGKTTTLVEAVVARVGAGTDPDRILTLTFSRKAAAELRERISSRLARATAAQSAWTFHAFAYALAGETRAPEDVGRPLRLLSGPEQDVVVRELLAGQVAEGTVRWPDDLQVALPMRGFAEELRTLLARARGLGLDPHQLAALAGTGRPDWASAAHFLAEYLDVLDAQGLLDYGELVHRAVVLAESDEGRALLRGRYDLVVVDEYQDTDPAQERLLRALAGDGRDLLVVGDPDQSIYAFRGAQVRGLLDFCVRFPQADGSPAAVSALAVSRRAGPSLLAASRSVARRLPLAGAGLADHLRVHRELVPAEGAADGVVEVLTFPSGGTQLEAVADLLRREHLDAGTPWGQMAVLVRSGARSVPSVRRVLGAAGVPVEVAGDELPLSREPAVQPLLLALRVVDDPTMLTAEAARALLLSPLGGADSSGLRRLGRALREEERGLAPAGGLPRPSAELIREALAEPVVLATVDDRVAGPAVRLGRLLQRARSAAAGGSAHDVLWALWEGTPWPRRLAAASAGGGPAGRAADRDLDAVVALFDLAARDEERVDRRGVRVFVEELEAQQIPADTLAERGLRGDTVRLLTAHRSKGLEWDVVVVVDVQEDTWPDLRHRGSLLQADRLAADGFTDPPPLAAVLAEERRLFYVAVTRARRRLVVTAVDSPEDDGVRPSRFLSELGVPPRSVADRPTRPLTLPALVAELRSVAADPTQSAALRQAAADRLARLAGATAGGVALVPAAHPDRWWGVADLSTADRPLFPDDQEIHLSGSSLTGLHECPLRWFLDHEVRARDSRSTALGFGSIVHALAHHVASGGPTDVDELMALVDPVWDQLAFEARWLSDLERSRARDAVERLLAWHVADRGRRVVASEQPFLVRLTVGGRPVVLRGSMDRVEVDADGLVHVVDFKTSKQVPTAQQAAEHVQLGVYLKVVAEGALAELAGDRAAGAELVMLKHSTKGGLPKVVRQAPAQPDDEGRTPVDVLVAEAVRRMAEEEFPPTPNQHCTYCQFRAVCPARDEGRQVLR
jgi:superfamily I DNA/RNA helicase/RecB family exonuclease